ncbi:Zinc/cadmium resistance protein [Beauveria bassiana D1-5]|uniref:Zinc/cadmium resistance protein n=1 Tax=Beauveria bassiana D1-5 TaxID=1245745 RepID=A0A0A2VN17_BEABA|nr:Zinc/cadmium resistance protein [Beauveria bassiana D1-5]
MGRFRFDRRNRLVATIAISLAFFVAEIAAGFYTHSLALIADAFHYLSDLLGFVVALAALQVGKGTRLRETSVLTYAQVSEGSTPAPPGYTFGWQRATLLGAFFNGVFLLALGISILVQAIERFINISPIEDPKLVLIIGSVGLALNVLVMSFLHEHDHDHGHGHNPENVHSHSHSHHNDKEPQTQVSEEAIESNVPVGDSDKGSEFSASSITSHVEHKHSVQMAAAAHSHRDLGMMGAFLHVVGDAINNVGVIISALIIWRVEGEKKYYADPAIGVFIAIMIFFTAIPLTKKAGRILMQTAPEEIDIKDIKEDIEMIPGVDSVHELHIWRLDQRKSIASAHIVVNNGFSGKWLVTAKTILECFHAPTVESPVGKLERPPANILAASGGGFEHVALLETLLSGEADQGLCAAVTFRDAIFPTSPPRTPATPSTSSAAMGASNWKKRADYQPENSVNVAGRLHVEQMTITLEGMNRLTDSGLLALKNENYINHDEYYNAYDGMVGITMEASDE